MSRRAPLRILKSRTRMGQNFQKIGRNLRKGPGHTTVCRWCSAGACWVSRDPTLRDSALPASNLRCLRPLPVCCEGTDLVSGNISPQRSVSLIDSLREGVTQASCPRSVPATTLAAVQSPLSERLPGGAALLVRPAYRRTFAPPFTPNSMAALRRCDSPYIASGPGATVNGPCVVT